MTVNFIKLLSSLGFIHQPSPPYNEDCVEEVNKKLDTMGYNIGIRLIEVGRCKLTLARKRPASNFDREKDITALST